MILGDLGADVIKIERPGSGDDTRGWGPPFDDRGESAYFLSVNRNKLSVAADLTQAADRELLARLIGEADVVLENFRPGTLERHGLGPAAMLAAHPELLWCTITGFGLESPRPGYDFVVQAESGWMAITGEPDGAPMKVGVALADVLAGKDAAIQILGALAGQGRARRRANRSPSPSANSSANSSASHSADSSDTASFSRHLTVSLLHSATAALVNVAQNALVTGAEAVRWGNAHPNLVPYQVFEASDRPMVIAVGNDAQFAACVRALGLDALAADAALVTNAGRVTHRTRVVEAIAAHVRGRTAASVMQALDGVGVPCGVVKPVLEALRAVDGSALSGVVPQGPTSVRRPPPRLDAHGTLVRTDGWGAFLRGEGAEDV